jgi:hypothetical protein
MIIYFSVGLIYLLLHFVFSGLGYSLKRLLVLLFGFILLWPIIFFNSIRLCFKIGRHLTPMGRWQLFFPARKHKKEKSDNDFVSSEITDFF